MGVGNLMVAAGMPAAVGGTAATGALTVGAGGIAVVA